MFSIFKSLAAKQASLLATFQPRNRVRSTRTGREFEVVSVGCGFAYLRTEEGQLRVVDWMTPAGTLRDEVADSWQLVRKAPAIAGAPLLAQG